LKKKEQPFMDFHPIFENIPSCYQHNDPIRYHYYYNKKKARQMSNFLHQAYTKNN